MLHMNHIMFWFLYSWEVLTQLLRTYCMSFYGCALWNLSNRSIKALDVCINKVLRHIWSLPYNCHTDILHLVAGSDSIFNVCHNHFCKILCSANISCNHLVHCFSRLLMCLVVIFNFKYGSDFARNYSCGNISVVNLIREIRDIVFLCMVLIRTCLIWLCVLFHVKSNRNLCILIFVLNFLT